VSCAFLLLSHTAPTWKILWLFKHVFCLSLKLKPSRLPHARYSTSRVHDCFRLRKGTLDSNFRTRSLAEAEPREPRASCAHFYTWPEAESIADSFGLMNLGYCWPTLRVGLGSLGSNLSSYSFSNCWSLVSGSSALSKEFLRLSFRSQLIISREKGKSGRALSHPSPLCQSSRIPRCPAFFTAVSYSDCFDQSF